MESHHSGAHDGYQREPIGGSKGGAHDGQHSNFIVKLIIATGTLNGGRHPNSHILTKACLPHGSAHWQTIWRAEYTRQIKIEVPCTDREELTGQVYFSGLGHVVDNGIERIA